MFFGSDDHAQAAANLFSLVASCKLHGLDPELYLTELIVVSTCLGVSRARNEVNRSGIFHAVEDSTKVDGARASEQRPQGVVNTRLGVPRARNEVSTCGLTLDPTGGGNKLAPAQEAANQKGRSASP
jgi:hypothetical protein